MNFHTGIGGWLIKILLALLIVSFAVWGIEDMLFKQARYTTVAKVGKVTITNQMLGQEVRREEDGLRVSLGSQYSPDLIRQLNLEGQVLEKLIQRNLIQQEAYALGLTPSNADIIDDIQHTPAFQNEQGVFDKEKFMAVLRRNKLSEKDYVEQLRNAVATQMLLATLSRAYPSDAEITTLYKTLKETRSGNMYILSGQSITIDTPAEEALQTYHRENPTEFMTPELRSASYLVLSPETAQKNLVVNESDLHSFYQERLDEFKRGEQRDVLQLLFDNEANAQKAADLLSSGKSLTETAKLAGAQGGKPIIMGLVERSKIFTEAADSVFSLAAGATTPPIKTGFGWHIFQVVRIEEPRTLSFEEAKPLLEQDARQFALDHAVGKITNQIEDALASGSSLHEAAKAIGLTVHSIPAIDRQGRTADGKQVKDLPQLDRFLEVLFTTDEKMESSIKSSKGGEYYLLRTESVTPERIRPLADVRDQVLQAASKRARQQKLRELAKEISLNFADPAARAALISKHRLKEANFGPVRRNQENNSLPEAVMDEIFDKHIDESTSMAELGSGDWVLAVVTQITPHNAEPKPEEFAALKRSIEKSTADEMTRQYFEYLKVKYNVTIDQKVLAEVRRAP